MTIEEALAASVVEPVNDIFEINPETRVITVPASEKLFGVANDGNSERKHFRCPKIVGNNIDLSTMHLYVNYQNANGEKSAYLVEDVQTDEDYITFSWLISPNVTAYKGQIKYIVCAKNGATAEWNTTLAEGTVLEGLEATEEIVEKNPDIIEQILARLDNVTEVPQEKISSAVEEYLQKNPVSVPTKLSDLQDDTTHRTVTDTEKESWDSKSDFTSWVDIYPEYTYAMEVPVINYGALRTVYFYDSDKTYISKLDYNLWNHIQVQTVDMPEGTRYVRTSQYSAQKGFLMFYRIA